MQYILVDISLWLLALAIGLMGGLYFAFSTFVMQALGDIDRVHAITAMKSINAKILKTIFIPMFFGTVVVSLVLMAAAGLTFGSTRSYLIIAAGSVYVIGMFAVTVRFNVPLNNALAATDADSDVADDVWRRYLREWTAWNHVRTIACLLALALYIGALLAGA